MNSTLKKYLLILNLLLLTGFANLYANSCLETVSAEETQSTLNSSKNLLTPSINHILDITSQPDRDKKTFSEFIDSETFEENDEEHVDINFTPSNLYCLITAINSARLLDGLNCKLQEYTQRYIYNNSKTPRSLQAKLQVFII